MEEKTTCENRKKPRKVTRIAIFVIAITVVLTLPVLSWVFLNKQLLAYAPISSPDALYIGAGHRDIEHDTFESIRYLYFDSVNAGEEYSDHVFCVYGRAISGFKLQLAYTTNNQFIYEVYNATESTTPSEGAVKYVTHSDTPETFYYSVNGGMIAGSFLNKREVDGEALANGDEHSVTYGTYENVNPYAEPIYWQTDAVIRGNSKADFVNYYILRVRTNGNVENDRETDILCIAAKSFTYVGEDVTTE